MYPDALNTPFARKHAERMASDAGAKAILQSKS